jgi:hypothetical protein
MLACDGIECGSTRFEASQTSVLSVQKSRIMKSPCTIVHGDVLTSRCIELSKYNVYSFLDKERIGVSQKTTPTKSDLGKLRQQLRTRAYHVFDEYGIKRVGTGS